MTRTKKNFVEIYQSEIQKSQKIFIKRKILSSLGMEIIALFEGRESWQYCKIISKIFGLNFTWNIWVENQSIWRRNWCKNIEVIILLIIWRSGWGIWQYPRTGFYSRDEPQIHLGLWFFVCVFISRLLAHFLPRRSNGKINS